jgi:hypothetical protein
MMQNGNKALIILGTDHDLQKRVYNPTFTDLVLELCRQYKVDFIAEEANCVTWTYAERLSSFVCAKWANVDITPKERELMRLENTWDATLSCDDRFLDSRQLFLEPMREWVWVARAANRTRHCCLLICGIVHTMSVSSKLASAGHTVLPHYYIPQSANGLASNATEKRRQQMGKIVIRHVPMTQDECRETASALRATTVEEVWEIVKRMPTNAEEHTETLSNGNTLTLRRR